MDESIQPTADLREYLEILRTRKWSILVVTAVVLLAAIGFTLQQTPIYESTARVLVQPLPSDPGTPTVVQPVDTDVESQIIQSNVVVERVIENLGLSSSPSSLLSQLTVAGAATTTATGFNTNRILDISYSSTSASDSARIAQSFAENYIAYRKAQSLKSFRTAKKAVQTRLDAVSAQLTSISAKLQKAQAAGDTSLESALESSRNSLIAQISILQQRLDQLQPTQTMKTGGAQVIAPAKVPSSPASPDIKKNAALALFVGIALGIGLAFMRERLDNRLRGQKDIEELLQVPVLATIPNFRPARDAQAREVVLTTRPHGIASEAYRTLRTNLEFTAQQRGIGSILITSPSAGEGKTVTSANLAVSLAKAGRRVILVSADLRRPTIERAFGISNRHGLSTWLAGRSDLWSCIQDPGISNLRIVPCGAIPPNPAELLSTPRLSELINILETNSDLVVFDSPPVLAVADAAILTLHVGGTILVVDGTSTHRSAVVQARQSIVNAGGTIIGSVVNALDQGASQYRYYGAGYYSSAYHEAMKPLNDNLIKLPAADERSR